MNNKIVFMGTPIFAAEILKHLIANNINIAAVVTQPDKKVGRKREIKFSPVKEVAITNDIQVFQPVKIREDFSFLDIVKPDLIITAAYGQLVPDEVLNYPKLGCINVHGSLLPKYRGGAPMQYAILNGDSETGVTIMEMSKEMDAGDIISQQAFPITKKDTLSDVHDNMIEVAKEILLKTLPSILDSSYTKTPQNIDEVTFSPTIKREEEKINWTEKGINIYNKIRAFNPAPVSYALINDKRFKFFDTTFNTFDSSKYTPGEIIDISKEGIKIAVIDGFLLVTNFQLEGKKRSDISTFINGNNFLKTGMIFS